MKTNYFYIYEKLPNFNEFRAETAQNKYQGSKMKNEVEDSIITAIIYARMRDTLKDIKRYPIQICCTWYQKSNLRMDRDNRRASIKFILDAMQKTKIIPNDSPKYVDNIYDEYVKADCDYVKVEIIEPPLKVKLSLEEEK